MKTYSKKQKSTLHSFLFTCVINGTDTYVGAYSQENAVKYFQKLDSTISDDDVRTSKMIGSGDCIDRIAEVEPGVFEIVVDEVNQFGEITNRRDI